MDYWAVVVLWYCTMQQTHTAVRGRDTRVVAARHVTLVLSLYHVRYLRQLAGGGGGVVVMSLLGILSPPFVAGSF